jgi:ABC-type spermidine/putrescine transport system permease subunit I
MLQNRHFKKPPREWGVVAFLTDPDLKLLIQYHELTKSCIGMVDTYLPSMVLLSYSILEKLADTLLDAT